MRQLDRVLAVVQMVAGEPEVHSATLVHQVSSGGPPCLGVAAEVLAVVDPITVLVRLALLEHWPSSEAETAEISM
jgi:hypothetical protein